MDLVVLLIDSYKNIYERTRTKIKKKTCILFSLFN
jgi:hypothetical protein